MSNEDFTWLDAVVAVVLFGAIVALIVGVPFVWVSGFGAPVAESTFTGQVADVEEDSGLVWKTTEVSIKTSAEATEPEKFCVAPGKEDEILPVLRQSQETGDRVTVTYERGYFEPEWKCERGPRIVDVTVHDASASAGNVAHSNGESLADAASGVVDRGTDTAGGAASRATGTATATPPAPVGPGCEVSDR